MATKTEELPAQAADAATGAAAEVIDAASDPVGTTTKEVRRLFKTFWEARLPPLSFPSTIPLRTSSLEISGRW